MGRLSSGNLPVAHSVSQTRFNSVAGKIVHLGFGQFIKAHMAYYTQLCQSQLNWSITGVNLHSDTALQQLAPQDHLYTVTARSLDSEQVDLIQVVEDVIFAGDDNGAEKLKNELLDPKTKIVSFTITEKGYYQTAEGALDFNQPALVDDLQNLDRPSSAIGWLAWSIRERRSQGLDPITPLSLDNLNQNGAVLKHLVLEFAGRIDADLAAYIGSEMTFPCSMVDRIVPAVTAETISETESLIGVRDEACVATELFSQWVLEDQFVSGRPNWEEVGVQLCADVTPFEKMKLRLLNGAHSAIAYIGSLCGHETVADCMQDSKLRSFVTRLMHDEIKPQVSMPSDTDLDAYIDSLLTRFSNPHLHHRCEQIAMDGSEKIRQRWLPVVAERLQQGKSIECLSFCVAAWIHFVQKKISQKEQLHDPLQTLLRDLIGVEGSSQVTQVMQHSGVFAPELLEAGLPELVALYFKMISDKGISTALDHIVLQQDNSSAVR